MKPAFFFLALFFLTFITPAQTPWAPIGAKWVYGYSDSWGTGPTCEITCTGDSILLGKNCSRLQYHRNGCSLGATIGFLYSDSGKVYFYDKFFSTVPRFQMLFDINASPGDLFKIDYGNGYDSIITKVDSIKIININGHPLKKLYTRNIHHPYDLYAYGGTIIENIGYTLYMNPWAAVSCNEYSVGPLGCYTDSVLGFYDLGTIPYCDDAVPEESLTDLMIYPNPNTGKFRIVGAANTQLEILNMYGQKVKILEIINSSAEIDLTDFSKGIYFLQMQKEFFLMVKKIILY